MMFFSTSPNCDIDVPPIFSTVIMVASRAGGRREGRINHIRRTVATAERPGSLLAPVGPVAPRLARLLLLAALALPPALRALAARPEAARPCRSEGRGVPPRHWLGCAADPGPRRDLADEERLALGLPLDPNRAGARALAFVPGLTPRLARAVVEDRSARGRFGEVDDLLRVEGVGPRRLASARPALRVEPP
jgi:competence protein ComEA